MKKVLLERVVVEEDGQDNIFSRTEDYSVDPEEVGQVIDAGTFYYNGLDMPNESSYLILKGIPIPKGPELKVRVDGSVKEVVARLNSVYSQDAN